MERATDAGRAVEQVHLVAHLGQQVRCAHAADAAAHDENVFIIHALLLLLVGEFLNSECGGL